MPVNKRAAKGREGFPSVSDMSENLPTEVIRGRRFVLDKVLVGGVDLDAASHCGDDDEEEDESVDVASTAAATAATQGLAQLAPAPAPIRLIAPDASELKATIVKTAATTAPTTNRVNNQLLRHEHNPSDQCLDASLVKRVDQAWEYPCKSKKLM